MVLLGEIEMIDCEDCKHFDFIKNECMRIKLLDFSSFHNAWITGKHTLSYHCDVWNAFCYMYAERKENEDS
jgi:hypothetical protein